MKLSELDLPEDRKEFIREVCKCFNAQAVYVVESDFNSIGRKRNGLLEAKDQNGIK